MINRSEPKLNAKYLLTSISDVTPTGEASERVFAHGPILARHYRSSAFVDVCGAVVSGITGHTCAGETTMRIGAGSIVLTWRVVTFVYVILAIFSCLDLNCFHSHFLTWILGLHTLNCSSFQSTLFEKYIFYSCFKPSANLLSP